MTDSIKLEETLIDYMEIIVSMNSKLNSHINSTKLSLGELEDRITVSGHIDENGKSYLKQSNNNLQGTSSKIDNLKTVSQIQELEQEIEKLRIEVLQQKQSEKLR